MSQNLDVKKENLKNKIWITRKCWINASERLLRFGKFIDFINIYYSLFLIFLSLISISPYAANSKILSYVSLAGSVGLTISIVYATSLRCKQRSEEFKRNYIALQKLLCILNYATGDISKIENKYHALLSNVENHKNIDYLNVVRIGQDKNNPMTLGKWFSVLGFYTGDCIWKSMLLILPVAYIISILL